MLGDLGDLTLSLLPNGDSKLYSSSPFSIPSFCGYMFHDQPLLICGFMYYCRCMLQSQLTLWESCSNVTIFGVSTVASLYNLCNFLPNDLCNRGSGSSSFTCSVFGATFSSSWHACIPYPLDDNVGFCTNNCLHWAWIFECCLPNIVYNNLIHFCTNTLPLHSIITLHPCITMASTPLSSLQPPAKVFVLELRASPILVLFFVALLQISIKSLLAFIVATSIVVFSLDLELVASLVSPWLLACKDPPTPKSFVMLYRLPPILLPQLLCSFY